MSLRKSHGTLPQLQKPSTMPKHMASPLRKPPLSIGRLSNTSAMLTSSVLMVYTLKILGMTTLSGFTVALTSFQRTKPRLSWTMAAKKKFALKRFCWLQAAIRTSLKLQGANWALLPMVFSTWRRGRRRWLLWEQATLPLKWPACSTTLAARLICSFDTTSFCVTLTP